MNSTKTWMTAQTPSAFGMPICGHAFTVSARAAEAGNAATTKLVMRDRVAVIADSFGDDNRGLAQSYVPGTSAWSPPTC
ncbi:hypothetical protein [Nocardioides caricicola]|uniref:Uncharacterized protein n=1 Tax=Nocardioides caricicola TaxID=634770 RepID=A0ABW0N6T7_9ACTN